LCHPLAQGTRWRNVGYVRWGSDQWLELIWRRRTKLESAHCHPCVAVGWDYHRPRDTFSVLWRFLSPRLSCKRLVPLRVTNRFFHVRLSPNRDLKSPNITV